MVTAERGLLAIAPHDAWAIWSNVQDPAPYRLLGRPQETVASGRALCRACGQRLEKNTLVLRLQWMRHENPWDHTTYYMHLEPCVKDPRPVPTRVARFVATEAPGDPRGRVHVVDHLCGGIVEGGRLISADAARRIINQLDLGWRWRGTLPETISLAARIIRLTGENPVDFTWEQAAMHLDAFAQATPDHPVAQHWRLRSRGWKAFAEGWEAWAAPQRTGAPTLFYREPGPDPEHQGAL